MECENWNTQGRQPKEFRGGLECIRPSKERTATVRDKTGDVQLHYSEPVAHI